MIFAPGNRSVFFYILPETLIDLEKINSTFMKKIRLFIALAAIMVIGSCTVEKRRYTDGYHVEWHKKKGKGIQVEGKELETSAEVNTPATEVNETALNEASTAETVIAPNLPAMETPAVAEKKNSSSNKLSKNKKAEKIQLKDEYTGIVSKKELFKNFNSGAVAMHSAQPLDSGAETPLVVLILLAILLPPLAVYLYEGFWSTRCTVNLILSILCWVPGIIHALIVILAD